MLSEQENLECSAEQGKVFLDFERICSMTSKSESISRISNFDDEKIQPIKDNVPKSQLKFKSDLQHKKKMYNRQQVPDQMTISSRILKMREELKVKQEVDKVLNNQNVSSFSRRKKIFRRTDHYIKKKSAKQLVDAWQLALGSCKDDYAFNNETKRYKIELYLQTTSIYQKKLH